MAALITRIKTNLNGQTKSGVNTLGLFGEAYDKWIECGDWEPIAALVGLASDTMRKRHIDVAVALTGGSVSRDDKAKYGYKFKCAKAARSELAATNQHKRALVDGYVGAGIPIGSDKLCSTEDAPNELLDMKVSAPYSLEKSVNSMVKRAHKEGKTAKQIELQVEMALAAIFDEG